LALQRIRTGGKPNRTDLFRQAIALDPSFAPGHYGNALALQWEVWHFSTRPFSEVQGTAREEAQIAVSLDDKDATAHAVLAHMMMWGGEWEAAIAEASTAVALNQTVPLSSACLVVYSGSAAIERKHSRGCSRQCVPAHTIP
jgi:hypothetical protein